jgi:hypothetical protein
MTFWQRLDDRPISPADRRRLPAPGASTADVDDHRRLADLLNSAFLRSHRDAARSDLQAVQARFRADLHLVARRPTVRSRLTPA